MKSARPWNPSPPAHGRVSAAQTRATVETAVELLKQLGQADLTAFADDLQPKLPELLAPLEWLEHQLAPVLKNVAADTQAFVLWTWQVSRDVEKEDHK